VRSLGTLLGVVLREQAGDELFAQVEALRQGTIRRRDADAHGKAEEAARQDSAAMELVHSLPVERAILLTRAFAFYFELINLAETNHRKRRRVALRLSGQAGRQRGSLAGTLSEMRRVGIGAEEALNWLRRVLIVPVFTAHPTEAARRTVMFKRRRIGEFLEALDRIPFPSRTWRGSKSSCWPKSLASGKPTRCARAGPPFTTKSRWASTTTTSPSSRHCLSSTARFRRL
jgi:phosphoenolpyruvate carboxylase